MTHREAEEFLKTWQRVADAGGATIAYCPDKGTALLIEAAPKMLAALRSVLASVPFASYRGDGELEECEGRVRSAIAKATGQVAP